MIIVKIAKILLGYWLEILIGGLILFSTEDIRWFSFYFLIVFLLSLELRIDFLRRLIRFYQVVNEGKLIAIIKKLKISQEELRKVGDEIADNCTDRDRKSLVKDMKDLGLTLEDVKGLGLK